MNQQLREDLLLIKELRTEIALLKSGRKSNTSSTPSSQDYTQSKRFNSREPSSKKSGAQKGHKGNSLKMSSNPDETKYYVPEYCNNCGSPLEKSKVRFSRKRQEVVIPPIAPIYIEHQAYKCTCEKCGTSTETQMPKHLRANIQYGQDVQSLVSYLSVYQYLPAKRLTQFLRDFFNINMSEGTIVNILSTMSNKAKPTYDKIRNMLEVARYVGGDETAAHIDKDKAWFWIFQNDLLTYIRASYSSGYQLIKETFSNGFPMSVYVSDSLAAQLKVNTLAKQLCLAHLLRALKKFEEVFNSDWATELKDLFKKSIAYNKEMKDSDYSTNNQRVKEYEKKLSELLKLDLSTKHKKEQAFIKRL